MSPTRPESSSAPAAVAYRAPLGCVHPPTTTTQTEKAYQKQDAIFIGKKRVLSKKRGKAFRFYKNVGLGFKTPKKAIEGSYVDKKCPFTGNVSIRGRIMKGMVISTKMKRTIVVRRDYLRYVKKYRRCVSQSLRTDPAHSSHAIPSPQNTREGRSGKGKHARCAQ